MVEVGGGWAAGAAKLVCVLASGLGGGRAAGAAKVWGTKLACVLTAEVACFPFLG